MSTSMTNYTVLNFGGHRIIRRDGAMIEFNAMHISASMKIVNACASHHAGGPGYKGTAAVVSTDVAAESTGTDGATVAVAGDDDDDGDGDGDPDSDRTAPTPRQSSYTKTLQIALDRKRATISNRIVRMAELKVRIGLSRSTIYEFQNSGHFPRSVSLGARAVGWLESDIDAWMESRINSPRPA